MPVIFREFDHTYWNTDTNEQYMSVTTFIGSDEPFNMEEAISKAVNSKAGRYKGWERERVIEEWDRIREEGTALHKAIEEYCKGKDIKDIPIEHRQAVYHFSQGKWKGQINSEVLLWSHTLKLAGTSDIITEQFDSNAWKRTYNIFDIKTSNDLSWKMDKYSKQQWLYAALLEEMKREEEDKDKELFREGGWNNLQPEEREIKAVGIIHYQDYVNKPKEKPTFVPVLDKREWVESLYKNKTLQPIEG